MTDQRPVDPPSGFITGWSRALASSANRHGRALDVAMGRGRHALALAKDGWQAFGVDINHAAVLAAVRQAAGMQLRVRGWCADLTTPALPRRAFALVVVTRYLQRDLFPALVDALEPSGVLLYETFTEGQRGRDRGPQSSAHLLRAGELRARAGEGGLEIEFYEEVVEPDAVARLVGRKPQSAT